MMFFTLRYFAIFIISVIADRLSGLNGAICNNQLWLIGGLDLTGKGTVQDIRECEALPSQYGVRELIIL